MARCYICDKELTEVRLDHRDMKPRPCSECEEIIQETAAVFDEEAQYTYIESEFEEYNEEIGSTDHQTHLGDS